jgi:hypothetical protein
MTEMAQSLILKPPAPKTLLSMNMPNINQLFPGFAAGDFAVLYGSHAATTLASWLCIRAQLPPQLGGLASNTVFIDGSNTFRLYQTAQLARLHRLDPEQALQRIFISRAFTAYQMTTLIMQKLEDTVKACNAKLVVISDIAAMFLDKDIHDEEAKRVYSQLVTHLSNFARKHQIIIVATYLPHPDSQRNSYLQARTYGKANVVIALKQTKYEKEIILEKHPTVTLGSAELPCETLPLTAYLEA